MSVVLITSIVMAIAVSVYVQGHMREPCSQMHGSMYSANSLQVCHDIVINIRVSLLVVSLEAGSAADPVAK